MSNTLFRLTSQIVKHLMGFCGAVIALLEPTLPFIGVCTIAVLFDCYTAWSLSRRVKKAHPNANDGKFKSKHFARVFNTLLRIYAIVILAYLIDQYVVKDFNLHLHNIVAGAVCFWQIWSMLENESSCNNASWAKLAQKILIDKTERHFDIDLSSIKKKEDGTDRKNR